MRKRLTKQIDDAKVFGIQSFCKDLLAVADVLNKASADVTEEIVAKENSSYLKDVVEGVRLTEAQLQQGRNNAVSLSLLATCTNIICVGHWCSELNKRPVILSSDADV